MSGRLRAQVLESLSPTSRSYWEAECAYFDQITAISGTGGEGGHARGGGCWQHFLDVWMEELRVLTVCTAPWDSPYTRLPPPPTLQAS